MKIFRNFLSVALLALVVLTSCTLDREKTIVDGSLTVAAEFTNYPTAVTTLDKSQMSAVQVVFGWNEAVYSYPAAVTYTLEAVLEDQAVILGSTSSNSLGLQTETLNNLLVNNLGAVPGETFTCNVRLLSSLGTTTAYDTVSLAVPFSVIPFSGEPTPLYVVGAFNNWSHSNAIALWSVTSNGIYTGYIPLFVTPSVGVAAIEDAPDPVTPFVLTTGLNWDFKYASTDGDFGTLEENAGSDILLPSGYLYQVEVNTNTLVGSVISNNITRIGLVGSATPNGWETPDTELVWTPEEKAYVATGVEMIDGAFKFRANNLWDVNWGAGAEAGELAINGSDITFDLAPGRYTVKLDIFQVVPTYEFIPDVQ